MKYFAWWLLANLFFAAALVTAQEQSLSEIAVVSKYVGATVDIAEQDYYQVFPRVRGFLSGQFIDTGKDIEAIILTKRGRTIRPYTRRAFYDLGVRIGLAGPIQPVDWAELSGQNAFDAVVDFITGIPPGVRISLYRGLKKPIRGTYRGFSGHTFRVVAGSVETIHEAALEEVTSIHYRNATPVVDIPKDLRVVATTGLAGMLLGEGWNLARQALGRYPQGNDAWFNRFLGGLVGLNGAIYAVRWVRQRRMPDYTLRISRKDREKIRTYTYLMFTPS